MEVGRLEARVGEVRRFNRFFTRRIGVLREGLLHGPYSLTLRIIQGVQLEHYEQGSPRTLLRLSVEFV